MAGPAGGWSEPAPATSARSVLGGYRAYARRWVFLLVISLLSCSNATVGAGPGPGRRGKAAGQAGTLPSPARRRPVRAERRVPLENRPPRARSASPGTQLSRPATAEPRARAGRGRRAPSLAEAAQGGRVPCLSSRGPGPETRCGFDRMPLLPPKESLSTGTEGSSRGLPSLPSAHPPQPGHPLCPPTCLSSLGPGRRPRVSGSLPRSLTLEEAFLACPLSPFLHSHPAGVSSEPSAVVELSPLLAGTVLIITASETREAPARTGSAGSGAPALPTCCSPRLAPRGPRGLGPLPAQHSHGSASRPFSAPPALGRASCALDCMLFLT